MPKNVGRVGVDYAGPPTALLIDPKVPNVYVNGFPIAVIGTTVTPHGKVPHAPIGPIPVTMVTGSPNVYAGAFLVCGSRDAASCGDLLVSTSNVFVN